MRQSFEEWLRDKQIKDAPTLEFVSWLSHKRISDIIEYAEEWSAQQPEDALITYLNKWSEDFFKEFNAKKQTDDEVYEALNDMYQQFGGMLLGLHPNDRRTKAINKAKAILARKGKKDGERGD